MKDISNYVDGLKIVVQKAIKRRKVTVSLPTAFLDKVQQNGSSINQLLNILLADYMEYGPHWDMEAGRITGDPGFEPGPDDEPLSDEEAALYS